MRIVNSLYLLALVATSSGSLLEMSQSLWTKVLEGGLTKIGALDPLRIPVVKVDQSEGNTSYRIILRSVEIHGLNSSSLESIHIARGRLKTNLSEHEAGYVSYTDQRELDTIRYRFHTVVKEPTVAESENLEVRAIPELEASTGNSQERQRNSYEAASIENRNYRVSSRYRDNRNERTSEEQTTEHDASTSYENDRSRPYVHRPGYETSLRRQPATRYHATAQNSEIPLRPEISNSYTATRSFSGHVSPGKSAEAKNLPGQVRVVYAERLDHPVGDNHRKINRPYAGQHSATSGCAGSCGYRRSSYNSATGEDQQKYEPKNGYQEELGTAATTNFQSRRTHVNPKINPAGDFHDLTEKSINGDDSRSEDRYAASSDTKLDPSNNRGKHQQSSSRRLEDQPGYVDIVYADEKDQKVRHFGNLRVEPGRDVTVSSLEGVLKNLHDHARFIIHNFTEGEALTKKNDAVRAAGETKRIKDLLRYAKDFQEQQGYYEEGMQLIYHYGGLENDEAIEGSELKRTKRAHLDEDAEDDVMHIIMRIRVPMLRLDAGYVLTGKVGKQVLRGNGLLSANFTELMGDFTLELKKVDNDTMIVRAARARLSATDKNITLQGMDEEGPVSEILTQGLMATEAVAAMLADDLATKALSEKTADSIIYRMYKNLPSNN